MDKTLIDTVSGYFDCKEELTVAGTCLPVCKLNALIVNIDNWKSVGGPFLFIRK